MMYNNTKHCSFFDKLLQEISGSMSYKNGHRISKKEKQLNPILFINKVSETFASTKTENRKKRYIEKTPCKTPEAIRSALSQSEEDLAELMNERSIGTPLFVRSRKHNIIKIK